VTNVGKRALHFELPPKKSSIHTCRLVGEWAESCTTMVMYIYFNLDSIYVAEADEKLRPEFGRARYSHNQQEKL